MGELREDPSLRGRAHPFQDRAEGGRALAAMMLDEVGSASILAIPPGGVPVVEALAGELSMDWTLFHAQRIEHPESGELLGGMAWGGRTVWDRQAVRRSGLTARELRSLRRRTLDALRRRARRYGARSAVPVSGKAVLVDDGTSGWPVLVAAVREARSYLSWVAVAMPVVERTEAMQLVNEVDVLFCPSLGSDERVDGRQGHWGRPVSEPEALAIWYASRSGRRIRPENTRYVYHTVSSSCGIPHDR